MSLDKVKQHGVATIISIIIGGITITGTITAVSAKYQKLESGYDTTTAKMAEIKADTNSRIDELKRETNARFDEIQKLNIEMIRTLGRIEGKIDK